MPRMYCNIIVILVTTIIGREGNCLSYCYNDSCIYPKTCKRISVGINYVKYGCDKIANANETVQDLPFYEIVATDSADINNVDNICNTALAVDNSSSVVIFRTKVYKDGSYIVEKQIQTFISGNSDIVRTITTLEDPGCPSCIQNTYTLGTVCNNQVFVVYKCYAYGDCDSLDDTIDIRIAYSKDPCVSDACYESILQVANSQNCLRGCNFTRLPFQLNRKCVTASNGVPTIGAQRVPKEDALTLP